VFARSALRSSVSSAWRDLPRRRRLLHGAAALQVGHLRRRRPKRVAARVAPLWLYSVRRLERTHRGSCLQAAPPEPEVASLDRRSCRPSRACFGAALGPRLARIVRTGERGCLQAWRFGRSSASRCRSVRHRRRRPASGARAAGFAIKTVLTREHPAGGRRRYARGRRRSWLQRVELCPSHASGERIRIPTCLCLTIGCS
jgi:hypothetical protein